MASNVFDQDCPARLVLRFVLDVVRLTDFSLGLRLPSLPASLLMGLKIELGV
jgi:hypothetical protein